MADGTIKILTDLSTEGFQKGLSGLGNLAKSGLAAVSGAVTVAGTAIAGLGAAATKVGVGFESSMAKASTLFGDVAVDTQKLNKDILTLSSSTGLAADTIGNSLYNALSAGIPVSEDMGEAMDYMKKNADLARAGFTDIDTAVTATAKVLNAYKMDVNETDRVHKILMATQNKGITTVNELGSVLAQVTPTAAAMNVSFEQVGAALATMTAQGTPTAQATTQLNTLFAELGKQGTVAQKALEKATEGTKHAGKGFADLMAEGVPLNEVLDLMGVHADMSDQSLIDMFGSIEAGKAALSMAGQNSAQFTSNLSEMSTSADLVGDAVAKMDDTLQVRSQKMMESVKNLGITIYSSLESPLKDAVDLGIGYIAELNEAFSTGLDSGIEAMGKVFADVTVKAADTAPQMIDAGAKLLLAFCSGIEKNSKQITQAAVKVGTALVSGLTKLVPQIGKIGLKIITQFSKELFGYNIGSKVEKLGKSIGDAFEKMSKAVLTALDKLGPAMSKVADAFLDTATGAITILGDSISFLVENCDILLPVLAAVVTGMTAWGIVNTISQGMGVANAAITAFTAAVSAEGIAHAASTVAITAKQVAMGVLSGKIGLVTAAQWLWNTAMAANPIGVVITAVAALAVGIGALCLMQDDQASAQDRLNQSNENLDKQYSDLLGGLGEYKQGVANATGVLDSLNSATGLTSEKQQELAGEMAETQQKINAICSTASAERRQLTDDEIASVENLIQKQKEIAEKERDFYTARGEAVQTYAEQIASSSQYTAAEFQAEAQSATKSAQDSYNQRTTYANDYMIQQLAELDQQKQVTSMTANEYTTRKDQIIAAYQDEKAAAKEQMDYTNAVLANGYAQRATDAQSWVEKSKALNDEETAATSEYNATKSRLSAELLALGNDTSTAAVYTRTGLKDQIIALDAAQLQSEADFGAKREQLVSDSNAKQVQSVLDMVTSTGLSYDQLGITTGEMVDTLIKTMAMLPPESRTNMKETLAGMNMELTEGGELIYTNSAGVKTQFNKAWTASDGDSFARARNTVGGIETEVNKLVPLSGKAGSDASRKLGSGWNSGKSNNVAAAKGTSDEMVEVLDQLKTGVSASGNNAASGFRGSWEKNDPLSIQSAKKTVNEMNQGVQGGESNISKSGTKLSSALGTSWSNGDQNILSKTKATVNKMSNQTGNSKLKAPFLNPIPNASSVAYSARSTMRNIFSDPLTQTVRVHTVYSSSGTKNAKGGVTGYASGGVTKYAKGGATSASPKISKHAAGVFTKRTRLWDPVTGINEYGEAGHEALLPLKESVFNEIAKGIVRQLSPAKLSGIFEHMRSAVQAEMSNISLQMTARADCSSARSPREPSGQIDKLLDKMDDIMEKLDQFAGLTVTMDGVTVGKLVSPTVNEFLGDLYALEERGKF